VTPITIGPDFWGGLVQALQHFMDWLGVQSVSGIEEIFAVLIAWLKGVNFVTQTDVVLVSTLSNAFGLNQVLVCAERIAWLAILKPLAPLAFLTWINPKSGWIGTMYIRMWIGWLVGQILVILAIEAMLLFARIGGFAGFILSCGCLVAARHAVYVLAPKGGDALLSVGPFKIG
jgi:hypothetical protein